MSVEQKGWRVDVKHEITDPWEEWGWYGALVDAERASDHVPYEHVRLVPAVYEDFHE